jgi:membrane peptidoglycan carboxypeptidase
VVAAAHALGVNATLDEASGVIPLSLPLGVKDITPLEMATAYATLANDGLRVDPVFVTRVVDGDGNVIVDNTPQPQRAVSVQTARLATSVLEQNVLSGTGTRAKLPHQPAAGKTGTAQDSKDAWFVGYTPYLSTAVWMGNAEAGVEMRNVAGVGSVTGGSYPARIWGEFNSDYHQDRPVREFTAPEKTRPGQPLRTPQEQRQINDFVNSSCGSRSAEVDSNGDGTSDSCASGTSVSPQGGRCPRLLTPVDTDGDGRNDTCVTAAQAATIPRTTQPPTTTAAPG